MAEWSIMSRYKGKELYPHIFSPIRIGNLRLKNRIIAAPTSPAMIDLNGHLTPEMIAYLEEKARGGAAVVTYGEAIVHSATGKSQNKQLRMDSYGVRKGLTEAVRRIHNAGAYANIELSHGGMFGGLVSLGGNEGKDNPAYGPVEMDMPQGHVHEMPRELILEIVAAYGNAARICKEVGFDMVLIHAAHGWLFSQFLAPGINTRTDEFGGSLENRARFLMMTLDAVREAVGPDFPIECRFSGDDMVKNGMNAEECIQAAMLIEDKVDLFNISCGNHENPELFCRTHPSAFFPRGVNVYLAAEMKKHLSKPVSCIGSLQDPAQIEEILATGQADLVEMARAIVADPYTPCKALQGRADDITPCIRCYECFASIDRLEMLRCTVNPVQGQQLQNIEGVKQADKVRRILVAGGGPAGLEAAITAARRGHSVTLVERSDSLGGNMRPAGTAYFKKDIHHLIEVLKRRAVRAGVHIILNTEVTPQFVREFDPDVLYVAIGSQEIVPDIPGIDSSNCITAADAELHPDRLGHRVVIIGGGLVGTEAAVSFAHEGFEVSIVEMRDDVALGANPFYRGGLMPHVRENAAIYAGTTVHAITEDGVQVENADGIFTIPADTVVCAAGLRAPYELVDALCAEAEESYVIGDCSKVGQIGSAITAGYYAAREI